MEIVNRLLKTSGSLLPVVSIGIGRAQHLIGVENSKIVFSLDGVILHLLCHLHSLVKLVCPHISITQNPPDSIVPVHVSVFQTKLQRTRHHFFQRVCFHTVGQVVGLIVKGKSLLALGKRVGRVAALHARSIGVSGLFSRTLFTR